jgi:PKD repeat protein
MTGKQSGNLFGSILRRNFFTSSESGKELFGGCFKGISGDLDYVIIRKHFQFLFSFMAVIVVLSIPVSGTDPNPQFMGNYHAGQFINIDDNPTICSYVGQGVWNPDFPVAMALTTNNISYWGGIGTFVQWIFMQPYPYNYSATYSWTSANAGKYLVQTAACADGNNHANKAWLITNGTPPPPIRDPDPQFMGNYSSGQIINIDNDSTICSYVGQSVWTPDFPIAMALTTNRTSYWGGIDYFIQWIFMQPYPYNYSATNPWTSANAGRYLVQTVACANGNNHANKAWLITNGTIPAANFTATPRSGSAPLTVNFTDTSTGSPTSWSWAFGDGQRSVVRNPSYRYNASGTYTVSHSATNAVGTNWSNRTAYITVTPSVGLPIPDFRISPSIGSGYAPLNITFGDISSVRSPLSWNWSFGDNTFYYTTSAASKNPFHNYGVGNFTARLKVCNASGCNTTNQGKNIIATTNPRPAARFTTNVTTGNAPLAVQFNDTSTGSPSSWKWNFGDTSWYNTTTAARRNTSHVYASPGTYTATLTVSNSYGTNTTVPGTGLIVTGPVQTEYYYYAESGNQSDYSNADWFYRTMQNNQPNGNIVWKDAKGGTRYIDYDSARESHWTNNSSNWVEKADLAYFAGHGYANALMFEKQDSSGYYDAEGSRMNLGSGRLKWAVVDACESLNYTSWENWKPAFKPGFHMLLGWNTSTTPSEDDVGKVRGQIFSELMMGKYPNAPSPKFKILDAWEWTGKYTFGVKPNTTSYDVWNAAIYDTNCRDDYLPGWIPSGGNICPTTTGNQNYQSILIFKKNREGTLNSRILNLISDKSSTKASTSHAGDTAIIYTPGKSGYTKKWVSILAKNLGMSGDIRETDDAFYASSIDSQYYYFEVRKDTSRISFQKFNARTGLPQSKERAITAASTFLRKNNLLPFNIPDPEVVNNIGETMTTAGVHHTDWKTNVVTYPQTIDGLPVYNAQFTVELDSNNNIIGLFRNWRDYTPLTKITIKSPEEAFSEIKTRQQRSETINPDKINVTGISFGYSLRRSRNGEEYLEPVYIFDKNNPNGDWLESISISAKKVGVNGDIITPISSNETVVAVNTTYFFTPTITIPEVVVLNQTDPRISSVIDPDPDNNGIFPANNVDNSTTTMNLTDIQIDNSTVSKNETMNF